MAEQTREQLEEALRALQERSNSSGRQPAASTPTSPQSASTVPTNPNMSSGQASGTGDVRTDKLQGAVDNITGLLGKLATGIDSAVKKLTGFGFSDVGNAAAGAASLSSINDPSKTFNVAVNAITDKLGALGKALQFTVDTIRDAGDRAYAAQKLGGLGQGDSFTLRAQAQAAGFADDKALLEFLKNDQTRKTLAGSGVTSDESIQRFNRFAEQLSKQPNIQRAINENRIKREDLPGYAAYVAGGKTDALNSVEGSEKLAQATSKYVEQLERASNAYGLNRDAVLKANQAHNESAEEQLRQQYLGSDIQREQMRRNRDMAVGMGESFQDAMSKIYAGQQLNAKDQAILQMGTGNRTGELQAAIRETKRTAGLDADDPVRKKAERDLEKQLANASRYQSSKEFAGIGLTTTDPEIANAVRELQLANQRKAAEAKASEGGKLTPIQSRDVVENQARLQQQGLRINVPGLAGQEGGVSRNTGAEVAAAMAPVQDAYARNTIALSQEIAKQMVALGKNTDALTAFKNFLTLPLGGTDKSVSDRVNSNQETVATILDLLRRGLTTNNAENQQANPTTTPVPSTGDRSQNPVKATRAHGTFGETGVATEPKDVIAKLHKGETVLSTTQVANLAGLVGTTKIPAIDSRSVDKTVGTVKPVEKAVTNFNTMYDSVFKGTLDGNMAANEKPSVGQPIVNMPAIPTPKVGVKLPDINIPAPKVGIQLPDINIPAPKVGIQLPEVKVPTIPAPKVALPDVKAPTGNTTLSKSFDIDTVFSNMFGKLDTNNKVLTTNTDLSNKETTKQSTKQSTSISSIFDSISSKISPVKPVIPTDNFNKDASIVAKPLIDETSKTATEGLNNKKLVDSISSTITSVTGGGSTTRTSVQSEDAKAAEKQLADLKSQYDSDRAAISSKIRETLGTDAKKGDVLKELRVSPEAKALEDRLKIASESLNKRIDSGTSIQTKFESGITKSQLVTKETPSLSISEGMKGYNNILGEATVDEGDEEPTAINLNDAEPQTKDLHEQLIQLNTTMRQLVEHSADGLDKADALRRTTSSLSGNRFA